MADYVDHGHVAPEPATEVSRFPMEFHGKGGEYFKIWIVNILLSIVTLYIYSAWAKVRSRRYFYGNTVLDNSPFEYHATGLQLLLGRMIGLALFIFVVLSDSLALQIVGIVYLFLVLLAPWAIWRSTIFNARMSSYRNIRFGFTGGVGKFYWYLLILPFLPLIVLSAIAYGVFALGLFPEVARGHFVAGAPIVVGGLVALGFLLMYLLVPYVHCKLSQYTIDHYKYGQAEFDAELSVRRYYLIYAQSGGLVLLIFVVFSTLGWLFTSFGVDGLNMASMLEDGEPGPLLTYLLMGAYFVFLGVLYLAMVFFQSRIRNYLYRRTLVGSEVQPDSTVTARGLFWLTLTNLLLVIVTLGFGYPWAAVRKARFFAGNTAAWSALPLEGFVADQQARVSAMGEEIGDALDMDLNIGL